MATPDVTTAPAEPPRAIPRRLPPWPSARPLRAWQRTACEAVLEHPGSSFLASATPAAGKTTFGLRVAYEYLTSGRAARVVVVAPTTHICRQWAADAARYGIDLEPNRPNSAGREPSDRHGVAITYQTLAQAPMLHRGGCARPTLLVADEPHHMGEHAAWGSRAMRSFEPAPMRLLLSGTPFRSDSNAIPWVRYDESGTSRADFTYGYTDALLDGVCRPITFQTYDGDMEWLSGGRRRRAGFGVVLPREESARRLRTALDPAGDWVAQVLRDADERLSAVRAAGHPEAGGLVVASDKRHAAALAARLERVAGERPEIVTSDEADSSARIAAFAAGRRRWLVSVLMVSEGVDIPRLRVGVYATAARTELFFRQVIGRFVRRTSRPAAQMSYLLLPADARLKTLAEQIETERNHALDAPAASEAQEAPERERGVPGTLSPRSPPARGRTRRSRRACARETRCSCSSTRALRLRRRRPLRPRPPHSRSRPRRRSSGGRSSARSAGGSWRRPRDAPARLTAPYRRARTAPPARPLSRPRLSTSSSVQTTCFARSWVARLVEPGR